MGEAAVRSVLGRGGEGGERSDAAGRLELARGLLRGLEDRTAGARPVTAPDDDVAPGPAVGGRVLPVAAALAGLLPSGGLRRGSTVAVSGSTSLLLALLAEVSAGGAWTGVVGRPELGLVAAAEAGIRLDRLALVPYPGADLLAVTSALLDGLDVVAVAGAERAGVRAADRQRLAARARQRGSVLLALGPWPGADVELSCTDVQWLGVGAGNGRLCARRARVQLRGRGVAPDGRRSHLLLPAPGGAVGTAGDPGAVTPLTARVAG